LALPWCRIIFFLALLCETHVNAHVTVLVLPALVLFTLSPALDTLNAPLSAARDGGFERTAVAIFTCRLYCGADACKLYHSF
jgi:hypothetical protein